MQQRHSQNQQLVEDSISFCTPSSLILSKSSRTKLIEHGSVREWFSFNALWPSCHGLTIENSHHKSHRNHVPKWPVHHGLCLRRSRFSPVDCQCAFICSEHRGVKIHAPRQWCQTHPVAVSMMCHGHLRLFAKIARKQFSSGVIGDFLQA